VTVKAFSANVEIEPGLVVEFFWGGFRVIEGQLKLGTPAWERVERIWFDPGDGCIHERRAANG
jgi:hypothetical protein